MDIASTLYSDYNEYAILYKGRNDDVGEIPPYIEIQGKRIAAFDYGLKRIGFAVCDELHITVTPRGVFENDERLWGSITEALGEHRVEAVVIGIPYRHDNTVSPMMEAAHDFAVEFGSRIHVPVYLYDEAFSSRKAQALMVAGGMKKKKRKQRGSTDRIAAAVILREFLDETAGRRL